MGSTVAAVKKGLRQYLQTTAGLTPADGVTVRTASTDPVPTSDTIELGNTTSTYAQAGLARRAETPTLTCWILITKPGGGEDAIDDARDRAYEIMGHIEDALAADRNAAGTVPPPGRLVVTSSTLEEMPADKDGSAARQAQLQLSISWTSHVT